MLPNHLAPLDEFKIWIDIFLKQLQLDETNVSSADYLSNTVSLGWYIREKNSNEIWNLICKQIFNFIKADSGTELLHG